MASASSVPQITFSDAGIVTPEDSAILAGVFSDFNSAFGGGLNPALETPQGQLASSMAAIVADKNAEFAYLVNQFDPQYASGRFQDAIARIYFLTRKPATATVVQATITGKVGATIPAGSLAKDTSGNIYTLSGSVTIPASGSISAEFANVETGPIACAAGTLRTVYQAVAGWDAVNNVAAGTLGSDVETRADFELRRKNSVSLAASGTPAAVYSNVFDVDNVLDCYVIDNPTNAAANYGATNYSIPAHCLYVAAIGGIDADIAAAIWRKKAPGCDTAGNTTVSVSDPSGYANPAPSYQINFQRPTARAIKFAVQIVTDSSLPADFETLIKNAIVARFNGADGTARERIGGNVIAGRYYGAVVSAVPIAQVLSIAVGTTTANAPRVAIGIDQRPTITASDIQVTTA